MEVVGDLHTAGDKPISPYLDFTAQKSGMTLL